MTAGRGIVHSELPMGTEPGHGLQLWVNLPRAEKLRDPDYQELLAKDIPVATAPGLSVKVIAGKAYGVEARVRTVQPVHYLDFTLEPGAIMQQPVPAGWNAFVYILSGDGVFGSKDASTLDSGTRGKPHHTLVLSNEAGEEGVVARAGAAGCHFVLISGQPTGEAVVQYGPVVMTNHTELEAFFADYRAGTNGFQGAHAWMAKWEDRNGR